MTAPAFFSGTGRRKTAIARVRLLPGEGEIIVNGRSLEEHFGNAFNETDVRMPFRVTGTEGHYNAMVKVEGGGVTGQAGAIRHGIARALLEVDEVANRLPLRQAGLLTRDPRMKEPEKHLSTQSGSASPGGRCVRWPLRSSLTHFEVRSLRCSRPPSPRRAMRGATVAP
jgi:small subunit ribosomal protein S9